MPTVYKELTALMMNITQDSYDQELAKTNSNQRRPIAPDEASNRLWLFVNQGTWSEQQFLYKKLSKQWQSMLESLPKYNPNWTQEPKPRSAPVKTQAQQKQPKSRPKPKPPKTAPSKKEGEQDPDPEMPNIVFETPPVTPPQEKIQIKQQPQDKEFWDFYEKGMS